MSDFTARYQSLVLVTLALVCIGCIVQGESFKRTQTTSNHALIYLYRPYRLTDAALEPQVTCGHGTVTVGAGGYHTFVEEPGMITCYASSDPTSRIEFEARPETEYFVREEVAPGVSEGGVILTRVDRSSGLNQIESCKAQ